MMRRLPLALALALHACGGEPAPAAREPASAAAPSEGREAQIARAADRLAEKAASAEPAITATLTRIAEDEGAELSGLEHRLKSRRSLRRKIAARAATSDAHTIAEPDIVDALRYTAVIEDDPPGRYVAAAGRILAELESLGHTVVRVKNYWPRGDNYSGVNAVLRSRAGLQWELQFHTPRSLEIRDEWHPSYERLRDRALSAGERRRIFHRMAAPWEDVPIPEGALEQGALHAREQIRRYPAP